ncbi:FtsX-like permease family protein [Deminuibacter soli]|uniref:ABC3 transporter permease C-terminal domain-containing protein n=1 Tax=Deminuibacter soli TaxID=2291815 RepID=A0A3E1NFI4_9BACT|nr:FtsX-like permease family protein [Deminuibacter soli]RFM26730.1 hypothetical protein DXN05_19375 [Deminuibacter soli]
MFPLLKKLIRTGAGRTRFLMAVLGLSVALLLILSAVQLQADYHSLLYSKNSQDSIANFLVVNKQLTAQNIGAAELSPADINGLKQQPFTDAIGQLTPSRFRIYAHGEQIPFSTDLFFESVPDEFIDVTSADWAWTDQSQFIPMIVPNMFLDAYNFGFAPSQNLPQLTQDVVKSLPIQISISTATGNVNYYAKVVGFSDRISSLLVPQQFMDWANKRFGTGEVVKPSRLIIKTKDPGNPELVKYLQEHGLKTDADKTRFSKYRQQVNMIVNISWVTGVMMLLFAILIFTLFIQLTIASCKEEITLLVTLGTAPRQLQRFLMRQFFPPNIIITVIVLVAVAILQWLMAGFLQGKSIYLPAATSYTTFAAALLILLVLWLVNYLTVKKYIAQAR